MMYILRNLILTRCFVFISVESLA